MKVHLIGHKVFYMKSKYHLKGEKKQESNASNYVSVLCLRQNNKTTSPLFHWIFIFFMKNFYFNFSPSFATFWRAHMALNKGLPLCKVFCFVCRIHIGAFELNLSPSFNTKEINKLFSEHAMQFLVVFIKWGGSVKNQMDLSGK